MHRLKCRMLGDPVEPPVQRFIRLAECDDAPRDAKRIFHQRRIVAVDEREVEARCGKSAAERRTALGDRADAMHERDMPDHLGALRVAEKLDRRARPSRRERAQRRCGEDGVADPRDRDHQDRRGARKLSDRRRAGIRR